MIYIIRHGRTALNRQNALQGRSDLPLDPEGVAQARAAARRLDALGVRFDRVYTSPLQRAIQTARLVAPDVEPIVDPRLIEMDYGPYEGADLRTPSPELAAFFADFTHTPPGMEPLPHVVARAGDFMETLRGQGGNLLVSTHAVAMKGILEYLTPDARGAWWSKYIGNCAVYAVDNTGGVLGLPQVLIP